MLVSIMMLEVKEREEFLPVLSGPDGLSCVVTCLPPVFRPSAVVLPLHFSIFTPLRDHNAASGFDTARKKEKLSDVSREYVTHR